MSVLAALRMSRIELRRHDEAHVAAAAVLREAPHEPFGPAIRARPLRGVAARVVIHLLYEALLILRRQQREVGRDLQDGAVEPRRRSSRAGVDSGRSSRAASPACRPSARPWPSSPRAAPRSAPWPSQTRTGSRSPRAGNRGRRIPTPPSAADRRRSAAPRRRPRSARGRRPSCSGNSAGRTRDRGPCRSPSS